MKAKASLRKGRMDRGGYIDRCYYGVGNPVWFAVIEECDVEFGVKHGNVFDLEPFRARDRDEAKTVLRKTYGEGLTFYR